MKFSLRHAATTLIAASSLIASFAMAEANLEVKRILDLGTSESWSGQLFHANVLWTGNSRSDAGYHLNVFKGNGDALGTIDLQHGITEIMPYDANSVVVTGNAARGQHGTLYSFYSIVRLNGSQLQLVQSKQWPVDVNVLYFTSFAGRSFWGAPGGSLSRTENDNLPGVESIMYGTPSNYNFLPVRLPFLAGLNFFNANTLVAQTGNAAVGDINIHVVNINTNTAKAVFGANRQPLFDATTVDSNTIAYAERETDQLHLIDVANATLIRSIPIEAATPRGLTKLGHCLVTVSQESKAVTFIDLANQDKVVAKWDLTEQLSGFRMMKKIAVSAENKTIFLRSAFPYGNQGEQNGIAMIREVEGNVFSTCLN